VDLKDEPPAHGRARGSGSDYRSGQLDGADGTASPRDRQAEDPYSAENLARLAEDIEPLNAEELLSLAKELVREEAALECAERSKRMRARLAAWEPHARVWADEKGIYFQYADVAGERMLTFPVIDESAAIFDYVAWLLRQPNRWWLMRGAAVTSNPRLLRRAREWDERVHFVATPEEWIVDPRRRVCILQPKLFDFLYELPCYPIAASEEMEAWLRAEATQALQTRIDIKRPTDA
jgi:hypothetical protein